MGLFSTASDSKSEDNRIATTDDSQVQFVRGKGVQAQPGSVAIGSKGKYVSPGSMDLSGVKGDITFNSLDAELAATALERLESQSGLFANSLRDVIDSNTAAASESGQATAGLLENVLGRLSELSESSQTEGDSGRNKIILYVVLAVIAVFGLMVWKK